MQHIFSKLAIVLFSCITWQATSQCIFPPVPDGVDCHEARYVCGYELDGFKAALPDTILSEDYPVPFCPNGGNIDNMIWLSFFVCDEQVILNILPENCTSGENGLEGIQVAMYDDCTYSNAVYCQVGGSKDPFVVVISNLIPGSLYYLLLDGNGGSICNFTIDVIDGIDTAPVVLQTEGESGGSDTEISGPVENCSGSSATYNFKAPVCSGIGSGTNCPYLNLHEDGFLCYEWTINPNTGFSISGDPSSENIGIDWIEAGIYQIEVKSYINPSFANCLAPGSNCGTIETLEVEVYKQIINIAPTLYICEGECVEFCGELYCDPGKYVCDQGVDPCVLTEFSIEKLISDTIDLGLLPLCSSGCFSDFDTLLCVPGSYLMQDPDDCSTFYSFDLFSTGVQISLSDTLELNCSISEINIEPEINNPNAYMFTTYWLDSAGDTIDFSGILNVSVPGSYTFGITLSSFSDCPIEEEFTVIENLTPPLCNWSIPELNCSLIQAKISLINNPGIESVIWTGPNNFQSDDIEPVIMAGGLYYAEIIGFNACIALDTLEVSEDKTPLTAELQYTSLDCDNQSSTINVSTQQSITNYFWSGPSNFFSLEASPTLFESGWYTLEMIAANGCTWKEDFELLDISLEPVIVLEDIQLWNCNTTSLNIQADIMSSGVSDILWTTDDGMIIGSIKNSNLEVGSTGIYYLQVKDMLNGCTAKDTLFIIDNTDRPNALNIEVNSPVCYGEENGKLYIHNIYGGKAPYKVNINGEAGNGSGIFEQLSPGVYDLEITDYFGCIYEESVVVEEGPAIQLFLDSALNIEKHEEAEIVLEHNVDPSDIANILWYDDAGKSIGLGETLHYNFPYSMTLKVILTHQSGCTAEASITVRIEEITLGLYIPNIFSPNNDGINDRFGIFADETVSKIEQLTIFDRWGNAVFSQNDFTPNDELQGWNGMFNGVKASPGTYVYLVSLEDRNGDKHQISGEINLIR